MVFVVANQFGQLVDCRRILPKEGETSGDAERTAGIQTADPGFDPAAD